MNTVSYTEFRQNLARHMDEVCNDRVELRVTRGGGKQSVVVIPEDEYRSIIETLHLLRSPANARDLLEGIKEAEDGLLVEFDPRKK